MGEQMAHGYLIDMDGVIDCGSEPVAGAAEAIARLVEEHIPYLFVTRNSACTPFAVVVKLRKPGIDTPAGHVYTSAQATA